MQAEGRLGPSSCLGHDGFGDPKGQHHTSIRASQLCAGTQPGLHQDLAMWSPQRSSPRKDILGTPFPTSFRQFCKHTPTAMAFNVPLK